LKRSGRGERDVAAVRTFRRPKERGEIFDFLMRRRQNFTEQSGRHSFIVQSRGEIPPVIAVSFS
jgi:hypothetical protein